MFNTWNHIISACYVIFEIVNPMGLQIYDLDKALFNTIT